MGKILCILIFLVLMFTTCSKEETLHCDKTLNIDQFALENFYFARGSWWIYEEQNTREQDSVWVESNYLETVNDVSAQQSCGCGFGMCTQESYFELKSQKHYTSPYSQYTYIYLRSSLPNGGTHIQTPEGSTFYGNGKLDSFTYNNGIFETIDSMKVKGITYKNVLHLYHTNPDYDYKAMKNAWYAKGIYMIKFEKMDSTIWNLIRYKIVK